MGIVKIVETIKRQYREDTVFVKVGSFYYCYGRDSYLISYFFKYKINLLKNNIYSVAFSLNALNKVTAKLEECKINYLILDRRNNYEVDERCNFKNLNSYMKYYEKARKEISSKMRIEKIYKELLENKDNKELVDGVEKVIYERRKI